MRHSDIAAFMYVHYTSKTILHTYIGTYRPIPRYEYGDVYACTFYIGNITSCLIEIIMYNLVGTLRVEVEMPYNIEKKST